MESSPLHVPLLAGGGARDGEAAAGPREGEVALLAEAYGGDEADALLELDAEPDPEECARDGGAPPWRLLGMGAGGWMVVSWVFYSFFFFGPLNLLLFYEAVDAPLTRASLEPHGSAWAAAWPRTYARTRASGRLCAPSPGADAHSRSAATGVDTSARTRRSSGASSRASTVGRS
jgi:hypothetical protein